MSHDENPRGLYLRLSLTDRCNYRCEYCKPDLCEDRQDQRALDDTSLVKLVGLIHGAHHVQKLRLTGGEPLLRPRLPELTRRIMAALPGVELGMTTNGALLARHAQAMASAGLQSVNVQCQPGHRGSRAFSTCDRRR